MGLSTSISRALLGPCILTLNSLIRAMVSSSVAGNVVDVGVVTFTNLHIRRGKRLRLLRAWTTLYETRIRLCPNTSRSV